MEDEMLCDYGCGRIGKYSIGKKNCCESHQNKCPAIRAKNSKAIKKAHKDGRCSGFDDSQRQKSRESYKQNLIEQNEFEDLGSKLRKDLVLEEQEHKCLECGISEWNDKPIILELDHIDGNNTNNKRENLRCLCPNCHSQTETWKRGNSIQTGKERVSDERILEVLRESSSISGALKTLNMAWGNHKRIKRIMKDHGITF